MTKAENAFKAPGIGSAFRCKRTKIMNPDNPEEVLDHYRSAGALLEGHFVLSSGRHSPSYLQSALALQYPADASVLGRAIAKRFEAAEVETVCSPAIGGLVIGYEAASSLNVRFIWTERKEGEMVLRRGFEIREGEKVLIVEDVITTGGSVRECADAISAHGAEVVAVASIIDRSGGTADVGAPLDSLVQMNVPSYDPSSCPLCGEGTMPPVKPGSRESSKSETE